MGPAYVFRLSTQELVSTLLAEDGELNDWFGFSAAIDSGRFLVGARYDTDYEIGLDGSAYLFDAAKGQQLDKLLPPVDQSQGTALLPALDGLIPIPVTSPLGEWKLFAQFPQALAPGMPLVLQAWLLDGNAVQGYSASNGLETASF